MSNTKVAVCPECQGRNLRLHRTDVKSVIAVNFYFVCTDCNATTSKVPALKLVSELVRWVPIDAPQEQS